MNTRGLSRHSDFIKLWVSQSTSLLGIQFGTLAMPLIAINYLSAPAEQAAILSAAASAPWLLFGLAAGIGIDRIRRRRLIVAAHFIRAVTLVTIPIAAIVDILSVPQLIMVVLINGVMGMIFQIAHHAYLPSIVDRARLAEGNGKLAITDAFSRSAGPGVAGVLIQRLGAPVVIIVQAFAYAVSGVMILMIKAKEVIPQQVNRISVGTVVRELVEGVQHIVRRRSLRTLVVAETAYLFFFDLTLVTSMVYYARVLDLSGASIGLIFSAGGIGGLLGGILSGRILRRTSIGTTLVMGSTARAAGIMIIPVSLVVGPAALPLLIGARFVNAFGWTLWEVQSQTQIQLGAPSRLLGRVNGSALFVGGAAQTLGSLAAAGLLAVWPAVLVLIIGGIGAALSSLLLLGARGVRWRSH